MLRNSHCLASFNETHPHLAGRCSRAAAASSWPTVTALRKIYDAFGEALAACRQYEQLRSGGLSHDTALRTSLGIGPSQRPCGTTRPLYFAGRA
jgi:hypothetical protein